MSMYSMFVKMISCAHIILQVQEEQEKLQRTIYQR